MSKLVVAVIYLVISEISIRNHCSTVVSSRPLVLCKILVSDSVLRKDFFP